MMNRTATIAAVESDSAERETGRNTRGHLTEAAYALVKERLLDGRYVAGERISLEEVMEAIGASRQPVLDAMRRLAVEGFVNVVPQVGCIVAQPDSREIGDFMRMLASIEGTCLELAAERATDEEIKHLQDLVSDFSARLDIGLDTQQLAHEFRLHNRDFHHHLHRIAHSEMVLDLAASLSDRADFYIVSGIGTRTFAIRLNDAVEEHRRIAQVLSWRDGAAGRLIIESHVRAFIDSL